MSPLGLLQFLARGEAGSRRRAEELVRQGRVRINGERAESFRQPVEPGDRVELNGHVLPHPTVETRVFMLNKPLGQVCSLRDPHNPLTVLTNFPRKERPGLKPVGRLDKNSSGLLLLTDDGPLAHRLTHPSQGVDKHYRVTLRGPVERALLERLARGVDLEDGTTAPARFRLRSADETKSVVEASIHEGRKRQLRRMFEAVGLKVLALHRHGYGPLRLGGLAPGAWRALSQAERKALAGEARVEKG